MMVMLLALPMQARSAAWTLDKGTHQLITTFAGELNEEQGSTRDYTYFNGRITSAYEYGISDSLTFGFTPQYQLLVYEPRDASGTYVNSTTASSTASSEFVVRKRLWQNKNMVLSVQPMLKLTASEGISSFNYREKPTSEAEIRLLSGKTVIYKNAYHFVGFEAAYRKRFSRQESELHFDTTLGIRPYKDILLLTQDFSTLLLEGPYDSDALHTTQISAVIPLKGIFSLQFGVSHRWSFSNTLAGNGIIAALWMQW